MAAFTLDLHTIAEISSEQFEQICRTNPDLKLERTPTGELVIMAPTGGDTGACNATLTARFVVWNEQAKFGVVFDSSTCFQLPGGGDRSPDVAWVERWRWEALSSEQRRKFPPLCPDFVLELLSPTDSLAQARCKMQEYVDSGARLGWLIDPQNRRIEVYRPNCAVEVLDDPSQLSGKDILPGFTLDLKQVWG